MVYLKQTNESHVNSLIAEISRENVLIAVRAKKSETEVLTIPTSERILVRMPTVVFRIPRVLRAAPRSCPLKGIVHAYILGARV